MARQRLDSDPFRLSPCSHLDVVNFLGEPDHQMQTGSHTLDRAPRKVATNRSDCGISAVAMPKSLPTQMPFKHTSVE